MQAKNYPETGDSPVFYPDLNTELKVIPYNTMARTNLAEGLEDETNVYSSRKKMVLTNEVKKVGVIIDRG